jgi:hypothetical protein
MLRKILDSIVEACVEGFQWGFNLGRYGNSKGPTESKLQSDMNKNHKSLAESIFNSSCMTLNEIGIMYPTFFLIKQNQFSPIMLAPESLKETNIQGYASMVINIADDQNAEAMLFITEQWQVKRKLTDDEIQDFESGKLMPSLDPDRKEVLCLIYFTAKGVIRSLMGEIERGVDNTPFVRESKWSDHEEIDNTIFQPWR